MGKKLENLETESEMALKTFLTTQEVAMDGLRNNSFLSQSPLMIHTVDMVDKVNRVNMVVNTVKVAIIEQRTPSLSGSSLFDFSTSIELS